MAKKAPVNNTTSAAEKLSKDQVARLLSDVERLNVDRKLISLTDDVLNKDTHYYCKRKSLKRGFQKKWELILRRTASSYQKLLFTHDVEPSEASDQALLKEINGEDTPVNKKRPRDEDTFDDDEDDDIMVDDDDEDDFSLDEDDDEYDNDLVDSISKLSFNKTPPRRHWRTPPRVPTSVAKAAKTPPSRRSSKLSYKSPTTTPLKNRAVGSGNDFFFTASKEQAERHGPVPLPLMIQWVPKKSLSSTHVADAFVVVASCPLPDISYWKCYQTGKTTAVIEKPSLDFFQRQSKEYLASCDCQATKKAFGETEQAIFGDGSEGTGDQTRQLDCYRIDFGETLDVNLFNDPDRAHDYEFNTLKHKIAVIPTDFGMQKEVKGITLEWIIGVKGTKSKFGEAKKERESLDDYA